MDKREREKGGLEDSCHVRDISESSRLRSRKARDISEQKVLEASSSNLDASSPGETPRTCFMEQTWGLEKVVRLLVQYVHMHSLAVG